MTVGRQSRAAQDEILRLTIVPMLRVLGAVGIDVRQLWKGRGPNQIDFDISSMSRPELTALAYEGYTALDRHVHGAHARDPLFSREGFLLFCRLLLTCGTLREALDLSTTFYATLAGQRMQLSLEVENSLVFICTTMPWPHRERGSVLLDLLGMASFHRLYSWLIGRPIPAERVELTAPASWREALGSGFFPFTAIEYACPVNRFAIPAAFLDSPIVRCTSDLATLLPSFPYDVVSHAFEVSSLRDRIAQLMLSSLLAGSQVPQGEMLAQTLGVSPSTLRRQLREEGTSLMTIKTDCRLEVATRLLSETSLNVDEIAWRAGFSDPSALRRAIVRCYGLAPRAYRASALPRNRHSSKRV